MGVYLVRMCWLICRLNIISSFFSSQTSLVAHCLNSRSFSFCGGLFWTESVLQNLIYWCDVVVPLHSVVIGSHTGPSHEPWGSRLTCPPIGTSGIKNTNTNNNSLGPCPSVTVHAKCLFLQAKLSSESCWEYHNPLLLSPGRVISGILDLKKIRITRRRLWRGGGQVFDVGMLQTSPKRPLPLVRLIGVNSKPPKSERHPLHNWDMLGTWPGHYYLNQRGSQFLGGGWVFYKGIL